MTELQLQVAYATLAVFDPDLSQPFNDWTQAHAAQGFSWRVGSVSFRTLIDAGQLKVSVMVDKTPTGIRTDTVRAIQVPFRVRSNGVVEIASIGGRGTTVKMPPGSYRLICQLGTQADGSPFSMLQFVPDDSAVAAVLRADTELKPPAHLVMEASPA